MRRVVVTGIGALTPIGNNKDAFLNGIRSGSSGAGPITRFDATLFKTRFACELKGFNPKYSKTFNKDLKSHFAPNKLVYQVIAGGKLTRFIRRYIGLG